MKTLTAAAFALLFSGIAVADSDCSACHSAAGPPDNVIIQAVWETPVPTDQISNYANRPLLVDTSQPVAIDLMAVNPAGPLLKMPVLNEDHFVVGGAVHSLAWPINEG